MSHRHFINRRAVLGYGTSFFVGGAIPNTLFAQDDYTPLNNGDWRFEIEALGKKVGKHQVLFTRREDGQNRVETRSKVDVSLAGISVYNMQFIAKEAWYNNDFYGLASQTLEKGKRKSLQAKREGHALVMTQNGTVKRLPNLLYPSSWWNSDVLEQSMLFDMRSGDPFRLKVTRTIVSQAPKTSLEAAKYSVEGDINLDLWFSKDKQWLAGRLKMRGQNVWYYRVS